VFSGHQAAAHAVAGNRVFPVTLQIDDPGVSDEASVPAFSWVQADGSPTTNQYGFGFEFDKTITQNFGIGINWGWNLNSINHGKTAGGFQNLSVSGKYQAYVNGPHEFIMSLGVERDFGGTGNVAQGADRFGSTSPTIFMGKGFGDLPIGNFRALAVTGEMSYTFVDIRDNSTDSNLGGQNELDAGFSIQYSMPYLQSQVKDYGLPDFFNHLVPLVEVTWQVPTGGVVFPSPTTFQISPGVIYMADTWEAGIEAVFPGNGASGAHVGVVALFHLFFDDIFPNTLGKPLLDW
jgi:hypothetical protein